MAAPRSNPREKPSSRGPQGTAGVERIIAWKNSCVARSDSSGALRIPQMIYIPGVAIPPKRIWHSKHQFSGVSCYRIRRLVSPGGWHWDGALQFPWLLQVFVTSSFQTLCWSWSTTGWLRPQSRAVASRHPLVMVCYNLNLPHPRGAPGCGFPPFFVTSESL